MSSSKQRGFAAPFALVTGFGALFALGTVAAALHGRFSPTAMLIACAAVVTVLAFVAEPLAAIPLGVVGWLLVRLRGAARPWLGPLLVLGLIFVAIATWGVMDLLGSFDDTDNARLANLCGPLDENLRLLWSYVEKYGHPLALYTDKASLFQTAEKRWMKPRMVWRSRSASAGRSRPAQKADP